MSCVLNTNLIVPFRSSAWCSYSDFKTTYTSRSMVFSPKATAFQSLLKGPTRPVLVHLNLKSCIATASFYQWEGAKVFQTRYLTFLGRLPVWQRLGESEFFRPICQVCSTCSSFFILICNGWIRTVKTISCNQEARLPNVTDRMLPSSPSCQLQGMLWVNLLLQRTR